MFSRLRIKIIFLVVLILFLITLTILSNNYFKNRYLNFNCLTEGEIDNIKNSRTETKKNINLYFDGEIIPYSTVDNFYLFYSSDNSEYKKIYVKDDFHIQFISKINDYSINLLLYNDKYYKEVSLQLTNIPVIYIDDDVSHLYGFGNDIYTYKSEYSLRGNSSMNSQKKSYKLHFKDGKGGKLSIPLLGMNESNTWILNPIYFDNSYIREKLGYDIWNNLSDRFNHTLEYVEIMINGEYQGLYYLEEIVDINTFNGNSSTDLLISIQDKISDNKNDENYGLIIIDNQINEFEIEEGLNNQYDLQLNIIDSLNMILEDEKPSINLKYDFSNMAIYSVFLNTTLAVDNIYKNQKILFHKYNQSYIIQKTPWDLDWSFLNENIQLLYPEFINNVDNVIVDQCIPSSINESIFFKILEKMYYSVFRKNFYYEQNINKLIDKYASYITKYGAVARDSKKWEKVGFEESINIIKTSITQKMEYLDKYYGGL